MLTIETVNIADIKPFAKNAKKHPQSQIEQIKRSISEFGMNDLIAIDEKNVVIEGHGRLIALKQINAETVPCIRLSHLSESQKRSYKTVFKSVTCNLNSSRLPFNTPSVLSDNICSILREGLTLGKTRL